MMRRAAGVAALLLILAAPARAATLGLAEVRGSDGALIGRAASGAYSYPADGSILRIGSAQATAAQVELRDVSTLGRTGIGHTPTVTSKVSFAKDPSLLAGGTWRGRPSGAIPATVATARTRRGIAAAHASA